ncbi:unnamed protein product [Auanema sp. JU1783]|nr:unnamed protein product [Auanema sp. JU1783]
MVLESTMICVDNSEWMRNGDFVPTRLQCQQDAANLVMNCKLRANPENAVGLLSMANGVQVLSTMTQENARLYMKLHQLEPMGKCNFLASFKVAHLALKHRQNRSHRMRVVLFIGSPIEEVDTNELTKLAKKFKKEKVDCDVICFGETDSENSKLMGQFIDTLNGKDGTGSNLVVVSSGSTLTDALLNSPVCRGEDGGNANIGGGGFEFGVDPDEDPDLALALRVSMEEERARQAAVAAASAGTDGNAAETTPIASGTAEPDVMDIDMGAMTEEQQLEWALRMSMQNDEPATPGGAEVEVDVHDNLDELMENPELLQQIVNELPSGKDKKEDDKTEQK